MPFTKLCDKAQLPSVIIFQCGTHGRLSDLVPRSRVLFTALLSLQETPEPGSPSACLELGCPDLEPNIILGGSLFLSDFWVWIEVLVLLKSSHPLIFRLELIPPIPLCVWDTVAKITQWMA